MSRTPRGPRRSLWAILVVATALALWITLGLMARQLVPGSAGLTDRLFALTLLLTYVGLWSSLILASKTPRPMLYRALGTSLTLGIIFVVLEIPASLRQVHWKIVFRRLAGEGVDYRTAYVSDAELSYRRIPGVKWSTLPASDIEQEFRLPPTADEPITFTYDKWGYRNAVDMEHADIVLIGDSYVEGWYVSDEETVASRLSARLGRPVANLGVAGYGTLQELRVLEGDALARQPEVVVWFFFEGNDLYDDQD